MVEKITDENIRQKLKPGIVYLTIGTTDQVQWLLRDKAIELSVLWHPTTEEFIKETQTGGALINRTIKVLIIYPETLEGTGQIKRRGKEKTGTYLIPNDQFFVVAKHLYVFVICTDVIGEISKTDEGLIKKLKGGAFEVLNLQNIEYVSLKDNSFMPPHKMFPTSALEKASYKTQLLCDNTDVSQSYEWRLVYNLTTLEGVRRWGQFNRADLYKYFLNENFKRVPLLNQAKAWCLEVYLIPFIQQLDEAGPLANPGTVLLEFAYWVYCSHHYWAEKETERLRTYIPKRSKDNQPNFSFNISKRAKNEWLKLTSKMPTNTLLQDFQRC